MAANLKEQINAAIANVKDILNLVPKNIIGIDIGLSSIKMAEVKRSGSDFKLIGYSSVDLVEGCLIEDEIQKEEEVVRALEKGLAELRSSAQFACIGLYGPNTVARKLQLAGGSYEEIEDQVSWEAEQYLPFPIDSSSLAFHVFGENEGGGIDVLVAAAKNSVVENFKNVVEKTKLKVKIVDLQITAITNVFEQVMGDKLNDPNSSWLLVDIGAQKTEFIIYRQGSIAFGKEMSIGGVMITEEIQRQMGVNYMEAEDLKITGDENGNLPEEIMEIIDDVLEAFFAEIKKTVDFYVTSSSDDNIKECVISGGGALIPGLVEGLETLLGISISVLNPFDKFTYDKKKFDEDTIHSIAFRGGVALGLAMRQIGK
ncbi:MAG: hypothetical protein A2X86_05745 [Bdellovibrionales bacterium GWA2_49_15]|nr:MAG: hypothetical protein A2X86_05745 [Bdellovibrionales bacterium GWA2_49_15]